jgi:hypothetical protein
MSKQNNKKFILLKDMKIPREIDNPKKLIKGVTNKLKINSIPDNIEETL